MHIDCQRPKKAPTFHCFKQRLPTPLLTVVLIAALGAVQVWVDKQEARRNSRVNGLCTAFFEGYSQPPAVGKWSKAPALAGIRCVGLYALWLWPLRLFLTALPFATILPSSNSGGLTAFSNGKRKTVLRPSRVTTNSSGATCSTASASTPAICTCTNAALNAPRRGAPARLTCLCPARL